MKNAMIKNVLNIKMNLFGMGFRKWGRVMDKFPILGMETYFTILKISKLLQRGAYLIEIKSIYNVYIIYYVKN